MTASPTLPDAQSMVRAADIVRDGGLVALPTETVYGLAADATSDAAVAAIFAAKGRPTFNPLISHVSDIRMAQMLGEFSDVAVALADAFWPGPLTLVLPRHQTCPVSHLACAGLDTIAIRMPRHPIARELIERVGRPLAAPSANPSGAVSPTTAEHVAAALGAKVSMILDGGPCEIGLESTVVAVTDGTVRLLRPGAVTKTDIEAVTGELASTEADHVQSPGMLKSHYAPTSVLRLNALESKRGEALLAFGTDVPKHDSPVLNLSPSGDVVEAAANLFAMLRLLDGRAPGGIAVMPIPDHGVGEAINDRLARAAAPRPDKT